MKRHSSEGLTLALAVVLCAVMALLGAFVGRVILMNAHYTRYFSNLQRVRELALTGQNAILGKLIVTPSLASDQATWFEDAEVSVPGEGTYKNRVTRRDSPMPGCYYIETTVKRQGIEFKLHSYALISNTADYLAAVSDHLTVADGTDASQGKVYAPDLQLLTDDPNLTTKLRKAEYANTCQPVNVNTSDVIITEDGGQPKHVTALTFPQLLPSDMDHYQELAHFNDPDPSRRHDKCEFTGDVFPPGYTHYSGIESDDYVNHTGDNADHVYYCAGSMHLRNVTVHGQVLFVSSNSISISGEVLKATGPLPGDGDISSSTAHQAILVTRGNVVLANDYYTNWTLNDPVKIQRIQAMLFAPKGTLIATEYPDPNPVHIDWTLGQQLGTVVNEIHQNLKLEFLGGMTLMTSPNVSTVFQGQPAPSRQYTYDDSFIANPPPYLPAVAEVKYQFEEIVSGFDNADGQTAMACP